MLSAQAYDMSQTAAGAMRSVSSRALRRLAAGHAGALQRHAEALADGYRWDDLLRFLSPILAAGVRSEGLLRLAAEGFVATGQPAEAIRLLRREDAWLLQDARALALLGRAHAAAGDRATARRILADAMARGHAYAGIALGALHDQAGDQAKAICVWRETVARAPNAAGAWLHLAQAGALQDEAEALDAARSRAPSGALRTTLEFARAHVALERGEAELGFALLDAANAAHRAQISYDPAGDVALFATLRAAIDLLPVPEPSAPATVFVTGLPGIGMPEVARGLAGRKDITACADLSVLRNAVSPGLEQLGPDALPRIAAEYRHGTRRLRGSARVLVDATPLNLRWVPFALAAMPEARVVHLRRPVPALAMPLYRAQFEGAENGFAYDLQDIKSYATMADDLMTRCQTRWGADRVMIADAAAPDLPELVMGCAGLSDKMSRAEPRARTRTSAA